MADRSGANLPAADDLAGRALAVLEEAWRPPGFCVPNRTTYPHQWRWDSCFHAVAWAHLGRPERAATELASTFDHQGPDGFVPHVVYRSDPDVLSAFWGRATTSCLTQPPVDGHALAELARLGHPPDPALLERSVLGLVHLLGRRAGDDGLVPAFHPWESGCDDSPRWDGWCRGGWSRPAWRRVKGSLVEALRFDEHLGGRAGAGGPVGSTAFAPGSVALSALVAFAGRELEVAGATGVPTGALGTLEDALARRWDADLRTWADAPGPIAPHTAPPGVPASGRVRTLEALLPLLVLDGAECGAALDQLGDPNAFGAPCGPTQVHRSEPAFDPAAYWRGAAWPQLTYLMVVAARRHGRHELAHRLADGLRRGATASGFAEHWHPDTGAAGGASPQTWTALAAVV